jgi:hypothetical protein
VQLEESLDKFNANGLGVVTISYDTVEILNNFSSRMGGLRFPMLADPDSEIIEAFGIRNPNPEPGSRTDGMAFPGTYIVSADGVVREKFFHDSHRIRETAETILMKTFGADGGRRIEVQLPQFDFVVYASQDTVRPGNTITLVAEVELPERMHLYAPGSDYTAADLRIVETDHVKMRELVLPEPETLYLEPIDESVPVYHGTAQIRRDIALSPGYRENSIAVAVILTYQTCDDEICFPPDDFEFTMNFDVLMHDSNRAPDGIRHEGE